MKRIDAASQEPQEQKRDPRYGYSLCCQQTCIKDRISIWNANKANEQIGWVSRCGKCYKPQGLPRWWGNAPRPFPDDLWRRAIKASGNGTVYLKRTASGLDTLDAAPNVTISPAPSHGMARIEAKAQNAYQPDEDVPF